MQAILFDVYGTLLKPCKATDFPKKVLRYVDSSKRRAVLHHLLTNQFPEAQNIFEFLNQNYNAGIPLPTQTSLTALLSEGLSEITPYPETVRTLKTLRNEGYKIGLVSNLISLFIPPIKAFGLEQLADAVYYSCIEGHCKPDEKTYLDTTKRLGVPVPESVMVGDSYKNDYQAPLKLGMSAIYLDRRNSNKVPSSIYKLDELFLHV